jgi:cobalt-zinc-cadmium efflux system protein
MPHDPSHEGHHHHRGHHHAPPDNNTAFAVGVVLNLGFVGAEVVYGLSAHSLALLSDAGHNLSDVFGLLIAWGAMRAAKSLPTKRRTYGWRKASILAALINAVVLLVVVGAIAWEGLLRLAHPEPVIGTTVIWVATVGVVINTATALLFMAGRHHDLNVRGAFLHMAGDAAISLGVVLAGFTMRFTGWFWLDPVLSLAIGAVIIWSTWGLLRESINLSMDAVPSGIEPQEVEGYLSGLAGVQSVHDLHVWAMSTTEVALTAHLVMPSPPSDDRFLHEVSHELDERFGICHISIQIEHGNADIPCHQAPVDVV